MNIDIEVRRVLDRALSLGGRALSFSAETPLLGSVPELDSMAVVAVITSLEEALGIEIEDDDIDASAFETVGSLTAFVAARLRA